MIDITEIRIGAAISGIESIKLDEPDVIFTVRNTRKAVAAIQKAKGRVSVLDEKTVYYRPPANYFAPRTLLMVLRKMMT